MKILKLAGDDTDVVVQLSIDDVLRLSQFCQMAALATNRSTIPAHLIERDDLATLARAYAGLFELASMIADSGTIGTIEEHRRDAAAREFPFTLEGQDLAHDAKQVDELLDDIDGLQGER